MTNIAYYFLWMFVFTIPWEMALFIPQFGSIARGAGALALLFTIIAVLAEGRIRSFSLIQMLMMIYITWAIVTTAWTVEPVSMHMRAVTYIQLLAMLWMLWQLASTPERQRGLINAYVLGSIWPAAATIFNRIMGTGIVDTGRYQAADNLPVNELGHTLAIALAMACYLAATTKRAVWFWFYASLLGIFQISVLLTASRGATMTSVVAWMMLPLIYFRMKAYKKTAVLAVALVMVFGILAIVPAASFNRLAETGEQIESGSFSRRGFIWAAGWNLFQEHPIAGVGAGGFQLSVAEQLGRQWSPHNAFVSVGVELGLVGLSMLFAILLCLGLGCLQLPAFDKPLGLILLAAWVITALVTNWEYAKVTWFIFGLIAAQVGGRVRLGLREPSVPAAVDDRGLAY